MEHFDGVAVRPKETHLPDRLLSFLLALEGTRTTEKV